MLKVLSCSDVDRPGQIPFQWIAVEVVMNIADVGIVPKTVEYNDEKKFINISSVYSAERTHFQETSVFMIECHVLTHLE